jgi:hypothetical protein
MKQTEPERELSSQEVERLAQAIFGDEIPVRENLPEELEAARKRAADYHRDGAEVRALERMLYNNGQ